MNPDFNETQHQKPHNKLKKAQIPPKYREALEVLRETLGDRHPSTLIFTSNLGALLQEIGDLAVTEG